MSAEQTAKVINMYDANRDKARRKSLVLMRVTNKRVLQPQLPTSQGVVLSGLGTHDVLVYEDEEPLVMAQVETETAKMEQAKEKYELKIAEALLSQIDRPDLTVPDVARIVAEGKVSTLAEGAKDKLATVRAETSYSAAAEFRELTQRDARPLDHAEVIEKGIPEPQREGLVEEQKRLVDAIAASNRELITAVAKEVGESIGKALRDALSAPSTGKK